MTVAVLVPQCAVCVRLGAALVEARLGGDWPAAREREALVRAHQRYEHGVGARGVSGAS